MKIIICQFECDNMCQQTEAKEVLFCKLTPLGDVVKLSANMSCQANVDGVQQQNVTRVCAVNVDGSTKCNETL